MQDLDIDGHLSAGYDFQSRSSLISEVFPAHRLKGVQDGMQEVVHFPVYFNVRSPQTYERAAVRISATGNNLERMQYGVKIKGGDWKYHLVSPDPDGVLYFDLHNADITNNEIRFLISYDQENAPPISIQNIEVDLMKDPLTIAKIINKLNGPTKE